ncbi:zinc finger protein GAI-ASSOCIATED FACTOR 1 [Rosa sericea]
MSTITGSGVRSFSSGNTTSAEEVLQQQQQQELLNHFHGSNSLQEITINGNSATQQQQPPPAKKKRNLPGTPDPSAEVIALSPKTLMATNRFVCEICKKGFQRDQNLQLHRRGHNLPWKLKQRSSTEIRKRVYICPEPSCVHHEPSRALGDLTGIKKHFCRKHGEKKWKCDKCSKKYAVQSDWKAHSKTCGTREYKCDCGTVFSRRDSFITHRAFCDAIAEENKTSVQGQGVLMSNNMGQQNLQQGGQLVSSGELIIPASIPMSNTETATTIPSTRSSNTFDHFDHFDTKNPNLTLLPQGVPANMLPSSRCGLNNNSLSSPTNSALFHNHHGHQVLLPSSISGHLSATELLQKAAQMGATMSSNNSSGMSMAPSTYGDFPSYVNNRFMQHKDGNSIPVQETSSQFFGASNGNMGMFSGLLFDQSNGVLMKNMEQSVNGRNNNNNNNNNNTSNGFSLHGKNVSSGGDTMTVDFLGIGRGRGGGGGNRPETFHDQQQRQVLHDEHQRQNKQEDDDQLGFGWNWS